MTNRASKDKESVKEHVRHERKNTQKKKCERERGGGWELFISKGSHFVAADSRTQVGDLEIF